MNGREHAVEASRHGFHRLLDSVHPGLSWDGAQVTVPIPYDVSFDAPGGVCSMSAPGARWTPWRFSVSCELPLPEVWLAPTLVQRSII